MESYASLVTSRSLVFIRFAQEIQLLVDTNNNNICIIHYHSDCSIIFVSGTQIHTGIHMHTYINYMYIYIYMHVHILYVSSMCTELHSKNPIEMNENLREQLDNVYE